MEVTSSNNQGPLPQRRLADSDRIDFTRINRDGIQDATEDISEIRAPQEPYALRMQHQATDAGSAGDRIELSDEAKKLLAREKAEATGAAEAHDARAARLAELKKMYTEGRLN